MLEQGSVLFGITFTRPARCPGSCKFSFYINELGFENIIPLPTDAEDKLSQGTIEEKESQWLHLSSPYPVSGGTSLEECLQPSENFPTKKFLE